MQDAVTVTGSENLPVLPPVIAGADTPEIKRRVENFFHSVAAIFEAWVNRRKSDHTRRAYRGDVMAFVEFCRFAWPQDAARLLRVSILDVQAFKDAMGKHGGAPKTINRRISSLSSFYKFLSGAAAELRLPITVPNPAHAQFISRESSDPVDETRALSETRARQLVAMVTGDSLLDLRDRAILKFYVYTGARIETGCKLNVSDFHQDGDEATLRFQLKGARAKTKGIHFSAAESIAEYIKAAGIESGPLFRPRLSAYSDALAPRRMTQRSMYRILMSYLERLPGAMREIELSSGEKAQVCLYSPHSLRATTATLLLDSSVAIESVQDLLDHKHITTTQIYDKRRRSVRDSASHKVPI
ncbi:MAG: tyrosine-type recombinase/integrase [Acidobacteriia bacterium]|nr:tyrosine-type recombinase/integrase [Terriglobia bacterium]